MEFNLLTKVQVKAAWGSYKNEERVQKPATMAQEASEMIGLIYQRLEFLKKLHNRFTTPDITEFSELDLSLLSEYDRT
jgi:hypothetical protein